MDNPALALTAGLVLTGSALHAAFGWRVFGQAYRAPAGRLLLALVWPIKVLALFASLAALLAFGLARLLTDRQPPQP